MFDLTFIFAGVRMKTAPLNPNSLRLLAYTMRLSGRMVLRLLARIFGLKPCLMCHRWTRRYVIAGDMGWIYMRCADLLQMAER